MSRLTRDGTAGPASRDQILRRDRGQGHISFPCSAAHHEQDWQPYPVDPYYYYYYYYYTFFLFSFFHLTYSRWTLPSGLWSQRIFPSLPGSRLTIFLSRCKFSTLTTRQPMVEFYLLTFPRFPLRKKEHKFYFDKNRTHDFRTSRCVAYLLRPLGRRVVVKTIDCKN